MEDRKRAAQHNHDDAAPPLKRQATAVNGGARVDRDADMPWKDDLERFQKDAIYRQMQEYKRERNDLEARVNDISKRATYHDDHLRIIDMWWKQLLDEIRVIVGETKDLGSASKNGDVSTFPSTLLSSSNEIFEEHLKSRSKDIKSAVSNIFMHLPSPTSPDVADLQFRVSELLAAEKSHFVELDRVRAERDQLEERLENASLRYMMAEKRADRAKSSQVAKLERQVILGATNDTAGGAGAGGDTIANAKQDGGPSTNGVTTTDPASVDAESGRKEALAVSALQKEQLEKLETENELLTGQVTEMTLKLSHLGDDDYARSDLFKQIKSQYEDVIKRINDLEATNIQLREEAEKLQAERTAYRAQIENELQAPMAELESQLVRAESDLSRIRSARDELAADVTNRKVLQDEKTTAYERIQELAMAREHRIAALESESERLRIQLGESEFKTLGPNIESVGLEELRSKYQVLEGQYSMLSTELPSVEAAWKKASALAGKKVADTSALEEKVARLQAEKSKADQKYFSAMKLKESREAEVRTLRAQNAKSSEIVAQLKDVDASARQLVTNLERQLVETKDALRTITNQNRNLQQQLTHNNITTDGLKKQVSELSSTIKEREISRTAALKAHRRAETDAEQLRVRFEEADKNVKALRNKAAGNQSEEFEMLRTLALCTVCRSRFKNTALKLCGHIFCKECVDERIGSRSRKCPNCSRAFGNGDVMTVHL